MIKLNKNNWNIIILTSMSQKSQICIYTNKDRNEFAIGLNEDKRFKAMTKECEFYIRFVDVFDKAR
ncbi:MAG: hypothetical protein R3321_08715 [Nitrososphaeraceae archaeon]|nr:hypothetical protein [Nitrososphaeraceae archaeon]